VTHGVVYGITNLAWIIYIYIIAIAIVFSKIWMKKDSPTPCNQSFIHFMNSIGLFKHDCHFKDIIGFMSFILTMCHDFNHSVTKYPTTKYCGSITTL